MTLKDEITRYLKGNSGIADVVAGRVFPGLAPQSASRPYLLWARVADVPGHHISAASDMSSALIQVDVMADSSIAAETAAEAVREAVDGYSGTLNDEFHIDSMWLGSEADFIEPKGDGSDDSTYQISLSITVNYRRSVPVFD
tara:strand:- start:133 stop:558 length:426 start_codon:yes stop_codon:yes gene_type:complete